MASLQSCLSRKLAPTLPDNNLSIPNKIANTIEVRIKTTAHKVVENFLFCFIFIGKILKTEHLILNLSKCGV